MISPTIFLFQLLIRTMNQFEVVSDGKCTALAIPMLQEISQKIKQASQDALGKRLWIICSI